MSDHAAWCVGSPCDCHDPLGEIAEAQKILDVDPRWVGEVAVNVEYPHPLEVVISLLSGRSVTMSGLPAHQIRWSWRK